MHESVLETMGKVQQIESEIAIRDEGILSAIERDLGEAIEKLSKDKNKNNSQLRFRFLQYASEHLHQRYHFQLETKLTSLVLLHPFLLWAK